MANKGVGFDLTGRDGLLLRGRRRGTAFQVTGFERLQVGDRGMAAPKSPLGGLVAALTGRDLILKYTRVPTVPDWQLAKLMELEVEEIGSQAGGSLSWDYNLLPVGDEVTGEDTILLALARTQALDDLARVAWAHKGRIEAFTPNAIALYNAFLLFGPPIQEEETVLLSWMGVATVDLALIRGTDLLFARNVSGGLSILDGAIAQTFNVRDERASRIRRDLLDLDPGSRGSYASSQEEKVAHSVQGTSGQLQAALRSTLAFCKSQTNIQELSLDRIHLCGPGARVRGMDAFLQSGLGAPVEVWDPAGDLDLSACDPQEAKDLGLAGPEAVVALGLAASPCFENLYSIEILPETVKKRRRFLERTLWNIGAAVLLVACLVWSFLEGRARFEEVRKRATSLAARARTARNIHKAAEALIAGNKEMAREIGMLEELSVPLHGAVRLLRTFREILPEDCWVTKIRSERGEASWLALGRKKPERPGRAARLPQRTYLVYEGKGVEFSGKDWIRSVYPEFRERLKAKVPFLESSVNQIARPFEFSGKVDYLFVPPPRGNL